MSALSALGCAVLGLAVGSFLNVVIHRVPRNQSIVRPGSRCPTCATPVRSLDNVPLISWLNLRGRCRSCGEPISVRYLVVEALTCGLFAVTALRFGVTSDLPAYLVGLPALVVMALISIEHRSLPGRFVSVCLVATGALLVLSAALQPRWRHLGDAVAGGLGAWLVVAIMRPAWSRRISTGEVRLAPLAGALLGFHGLVHVLVALSAAVLALLASARLSAVVLRRGRAPRTEDLPFAPFLAGSAVLVILLSG